MEITHKGTQFELQGPAVDTELLASSRQFRQWLERMDARLTIKRIKVQAVDRRRDGGLLFAKLTAEVTDADGHPVPGAVFLRGDAVAVLVVLVVAGEEWVVLTVQPRFPAGLYESVEIPAGMLDDHGDFAGVAARELEEETGLHIEAAQLAYLGEFHPSAGGSDELVRLYACRLETTAEHLQELHGAFTGAAHEHERIRLMLVPLCELPRHTNDVKALLAYGYFRKVYG
jgi:8-oxo-dGTP pyrophosphatase MutT (NUDIX family)